MPGPMRASWYRTVDGRDGFDDVGFRPTLFFQRVPTSLLREPYIPPPSSCCFCACCTSVVVLLMFSGGSGFGLSLIWTTCSALGKKERGPADWQRSVLMVLTEFVSVSSLCTLLPFCGLTTHPAVRAEISLALHRSVHLFYALMSTLCAGSVAVARAFVCVCVCVSYRRRGVGCKNLLPENKERANHRMSIFF